MNPGQPRFSSCEKSLFYYDAPPHFRSFLNIETSEEKALRWQHVCIRSSIFFLQPIAGLNFYVIKNTVITTNKIGINIWKGKVYFWACMLYLSTLFQIKSHLTWANHRSPWTQYSFFKELLEGTMQMPTHVFLFLIATLL